MIILGLETSCDETAAALVQDGSRVLSSVVASQTDLHETYGGVVPELASRAHAERVLPIVRETLAQAGLGLGMVDAVAVGNRPGLIGSLLVGVSAAKALAWSLNTPIVGVDHVHAHLYAGVLREGDVADTTPALWPALGLVVSGGHTSLFRLDSWTTFTRIGATIDDAMGEAFDKAAAILNLPFPGGPNLDALARSGGANDRAFDFPVSRLGDSLNFSFSGLKTALLYAAKGTPGSTSAPPLSPERTRDLAASFQRAACAAATLKVRRALNAARASAMPFQTLLAGGGVISNSRLRSELLAVAAEYTTPLSLPAPHFCIDNAAMIAGLAHHCLAAGLADGLSLTANPRTAA